MIGHEGTRTQSNTRQSVTGKVFVPLCVLVPLCLFTLMDYTIGVGRMGARRQWGCPLLLPDPAQVGVFKVVLVLEAVAESPVHGAVPKQHQPGQLQRQNARENPG